MIRAAVLVPAPDYPEDWAWAFDVQAAALERGGITVEARPWNDPGDLTAFDLLLPLVAWGYQTDPRRWLQVLDQLEQADVVTVNPVPLLRWNSNKRYLEVLGAKGKPRKISFKIAADHATVVDLDKR